MFILFLAVSEEDYDEDEPGGVPVVYGLGNGKRLSTGKWDSEHASEEHHTTGKHEEETVVSGNRATDWPPEWSDDNKEALYEYVMKVFPEFAPNKVLRFSRLFGSEKHMSSPFGAVKRNRSETDVERMDWEEVKAKIFRPDMYESGDEVSCKLEKWFALFKNWEIYCN